MSLEADESALNAGAPELTDIEVKRRLRIRNQPVCYFGETAEDRFERLKHLEKSGGEIDYAAVGNVQSTQDKELQKIAKAKQQNEEEEAELQKEKSNDNLTPTQRRLLELRLKLNEGRKQNLEELVGEQNANGGKKGEKKFYKNKKRIREEENSIAITAEQAEYITKKKQKKAQPNFEGAEARGQDALYKAYSKRAKAIPNAMAITDEIIKTKHIDDQEDIEELNKERMANELLESINKREKFSRRRTYREDDDAGHINNANRHFNKKLSRAFDKHTAEIKQNLERGTAV